MKAVRRVSYCLMSKGLGLNLIKLLPSGESKIDFDIEPILDCCFWSCDLCDWDLDDMCWPSVEPRYGGGNEEEEELLSYPA